MSSNIPSALTCGVCVPGSFAMPIVAQIMVAFYHTTGLLWRDFCYRVKGLIVCPTHFWGFCGGSTDLVGQYKKNVH